MSPRRAALRVLLLLAVSPAPGAGDSVRLSGPMAPGEVGAVTDFRTTADGSRVVYRADEKRDEVFELFSAPADGSGAPVRVSHSLPGGADVRSFEVGAGDLVVFATEQEGEPDLTGLYSVPADGSAPPFQLRGPGVRDFRLGAGGSFVVFREGPDRLYSVPIEGGTEPVQLADEASEYWVDAGSSFVVFSISSAFLVSVPIDGSPTAVVGNNDFETTVTDVVFSGDGLHAYFLRIEPVSDPGSGVDHWDHVVFRFALHGNEGRTSLGGVSSDAPTYGLAALEERSQGDRLAYSLEGPSSSSLFAVDVDGTDRIQLAGKPSPLSFRITADGMNVVFQGVDGPVRRVPIDGSQLPVVAVAGDVETWQLDGEDLLFVRRTSIDGTPFHGLYEMPVAGGAAVLLNGPPMPYHGVELDFLLHPDGERVVYRSADPSREVLLAVSRVPGGAVLELGPPMTPDGHIGEVCITTDGEHVVYSADQTHDEVVELFGAPMDGSGAVPVNDAMPTGITGDVGAFLPEFDQASVVYAADQDTEGTVDLYRVPADGNAAPVRLTTALGGAGDVTAFVLAPSTRDAVFTYVEPGPPRISRLLAVVTDTGALHALDSTTQEILAPLVLDSAGERVLYRKGSALDRNDLFSCATDGSSAPVQLADPAWISGFELDASGDRVVYVANDIRLLSVPADGSEAPTLLVDPGSMWRIPLFEISPDGTRGAYLAGSVFSAERRLYSVPIDASALPVELSSSPLTFDEVSDERAFAITSDGQRVIYRARIAGMDQLHSATLAGGEPPLSLHQGVPVVEDDFLVSANGQYVFYRAEATAGTTRLFVLRTDGGWPQPFDLSGPLAAGGDVLSYRLTPDASRLVFLADKRTDEVFELFRRTVTTPAVLIHGMPAFADVTAYRLDPAAQRVQYLADRRVDGRDELYAAPLDGSSSPQRVSDDLLAGGDVRQDFVPMDGGAALYAADQVQDETFELFRGTEAPASPPAHLPAATPKQPASVVR